jgi:hypothetical protein
MGMDLRKAAVRAADLGGGRVAAGMGTFNRSDEIDALAVGKDLEGDADSSVSLEGEDESYLPFENGFRLGALAAGRPVWLVVPEDDGEVGYFFIGTEDEVAAKVGSSPER